ncbi:MAG: phosphatidate cytidylyltransferase [Armatimonadetes bacterium]|nr:phosphatidate cytidylyltransferase [Armatimonadota bacterium]
MRSRARSVFREMLARAVLAAFGIPVLCVLGWLGGWWWYVPVAIVTIIALGEYYSACYAKGWRPYALAGYVWALVLLYPPLFVPERAWPLTASFFLAATLSLCVLGLIPPRKSYAASVAATVFGLAYIALPMTFLSHLRHVDVPALLGFTGGWSFAHRMGAVLLALFPVWASDTGAFLAGGLLGRHKLAPVLSPNKTVEGAVGGLLFTVAAAALLGIPWLRMPAATALEFGLLVGVACQLGDLVESALKRDLGVKDFGTLLGPHGGVLDRFDGLLVAMPVAYLYLMAALPPHASAPGL